MKTNKAPLKTSFIWAISAAILGTMVWATVISIFEPLLRGETIDQILSLIVYSLISGVYFGGFIALITVIPYSLLFYGFLKLASKKPSIDFYKKQVVLTSFLLALPFTLVVFFSYVLPTGNLGFSWSDGFSALPWVLISAWAGILLPRFIISSLKPSGNEVAT
ncbi:hypothetical protein [Fodinibius sp. Rm-B-1B1-1]|uniref:hypothetical protein n=1 Tax=Fodinibius alkaliphilus TaxID=3140241 RepID=UPI00315B1961